jgi:hypothetical protein
MSLPSPGNASPDPQITGPFIPTESLRPGSDALQRTAAPFGSAREVHKGPRPLKLSFALRGRSRGGVDAGDALEEAVSGLQLRRAGDSPSEKCNDEAMRCVEMRVSLVLPQASGGRP